MNQTQTMESEEQTETATNITVEEVEEGRWVVMQSSVKVEPGSQVIFHPAANKLYIFMMDDRLFGGARRFEVCKETGPLTYEVATREKGLFPYVVLVDAGPRMILAEGSALPVFVVDY